MLFCSNFHKILAPNALFAYACLFHIWNTHWLWVLVFNRFFHAEYHILLGITGVSLCIQFISMPLMLHKRSWASYRTILALFHFIYTRCSYYFASRWKNLDRFFSFCSFISVQWLVMERAKDSHFLRMHLFSTTIFTHERKMLSNRYFNNFFTYSTWIFDFFFAWLAQLIAWLLFHLNNIIFCRFLDASLHSTFFHPNFFYHSYIPHNIIYILSFVHS